MNRNELQRLASEWTRMAKNDIRNKVINFMQEVDATPHELAYVLAISEGELNQIIEGNGEITLSTFAKLLIATGNALEIKPIEDTPLVDYDNMPTEEELNHPLPRPNIFERQRDRRNIPPHFARPSFSRPTPPIMDDEDDEDENHIPSFEEFCDMMNERRNRNTQPRDARGRFIHRPQAPIETPRHETPTPSPFDAMSTDKLVSIIKERLWDSEIDLNRATKKELVEFLKEKDKRMNQYKRMKALEEDPKVVDFKNRMKKTLDENPHLREWAKKFLGNSEN